MAYPITLTVLGAVTFFVSIVGFMATSRESLSMMKMVRAWVLNAQWQQSAKADKRDAN